MKPKAQLKQRLATDGAAASRWRAYALGVLMAAGVFVVLPSPVFRSEAIVGVGDPTTPLREAMTEAAVSAAVSKPVISRAAASLIETSVTVPEPGLLDKLEVGFNVSHAAGRDARLAGTLPRVVGATTGDAPGIVKILAAAPDAGAASQIATALAEALIAEQEAQGAESRRRQELLAAREIEGLKATALAAHRRFTAAGGADVDPAQARGAAAAQTAAAQARLDVVRAILASGTPPLSDRHDLPQTVAALQSAYLDQSQQLAKARETLGDRHTTVMSLQEGTKRAAMALTVEWKRLGKVAQGELEAARGRETALAGTKTPANAAKSAELDDARRAAVVADDALAQAQHARVEMPESAQAFHLVAPAPVPSQATGLSLTMRLIVSCLAGLLTLGVARALEQVAGIVSVPSRPVVAPVEPKVEMPARFEDEVAKSETPMAAPRPQTLHDTPVRSTPIRPTPVRPKQAGMPAAPSRPLAPSRPEASRRPDEVLADALRDILPALDAITPQGALPVVLIGANDVGAVTTPIALALSHAAAAAGLRVLVVEAPGGSLAASVDAEAEPALIDVFGTLRIALRADTDVSDGMIYLAPTFRNHDRIVAGLARADDVPLVDDLAAEFDLIVIDAGVVTAGVDIAACADAFLRVGRHPSKRDDEMFLAAFDAHRGAFLGTITASAFVPKTQDGLRLVHPPRQQDHPTPPLPSRSAAAPVRGATVERRRVGTR